MKHLDIPVGISDFAEIRRNGFYYIDKSGLIDDLLETTSTKVTLITRPRRFGKTLGMSMLEYFFDVRKDSKELFAGLEIMKNQEICQQWMNQYPTIFVSFRQVDGLNFDGAFGMLTVVLADLFNKHLYLQESYGISESSFCSYCQWKCVCEGGEEQSWPFDRYDAGLLWEKSDSSD